MKIKDIVLFLLLLPGYFSLYATTTGLSTKAPEVLPGEYTFYAHSQVVNSEKQTLVTGGFTGYLIWADDTLYSGTIRSGFVGAKDSLGQWQWIRKIEGDGYNQINTAMAYQGGWLIAGVFSDTIQPGGEQITTEQYQAVFLARLNQNGDYQGAVHLEVSPAGGRQFLCNGPGNTVFLGVEFNGSCAVEDTVYTTGGSQAVLLTRLNAQGIMQEYQVIKSNSSVLLEAMISLPGGKMVTGISYRDSLTLGQSILYPAGQQDFVVTEWDENLEITRMKISQGKGEKRLAGIERHAGGILVFGDYTGEFLMDDVLFPEEIGRHLFLLKFRANGNLHWHQTITGASHKSVGGLVAGQQQQIYLWGKYRGTLTFMDQEYTTEDFVHQWIIARFKPNGQPQWLAEASNNYNLSATIGQGNQPGALTLFGFNPMVGQEVFGHTFDSLSTGMFAMEMMDCQYAQWPDLPSDTVLCYQQMLDGGEGFVAYHWNGEAGSRFYQPGQTGMVTLELTNTFGCIQQYDIYVEVLPEFEIFITGNDNICPHEGHTVLMIETDAQVTWNTGEYGPVLFVNQPGEYQALAVNEQGCMAESTITVAHYETTPPQLMDQYWISAGESLELYPGEYITYLWSTGQQDAVLYIEAVDYAVGIYPFTLQVTDENNCFMEHAFDVEVFEATTHSSAADGTNGNNAGENAGENVEQSGNETVSDEFETAEDKHHEDLQNMATIEGCDFILYPNPGKGPFYVYSQAIQSDFPDSTIELMVFGTDGRLISKANFTPHAQPWMLENPADGFTAGTYHLVLLVDQKICRIKNLLIVP